MLVKYAAEKNLYLGCDLNHYFTKTADRAKEMQKDGKIGQLLYCIHKVGFNGWQGTYGGVGSPRWQTPYSHLKAFCAHPFSVMRYFCGDIVAVQAFLDEQAGQCAYCLSGIIISAKALLDHNPSPTRAEIAAALDKNLCRCGVHARILRAVEKAAAMLRDGGRP